MKRSASRRIALAGILIALGLLLPFLTAQIPSLGNMLLPMHIPALLAGYLLGGPSGLLIGFFLPLLRHLLFSMPPLYSAIPMAFELASYGFVSGLLYQIFPKKRPYLYLNLLLAMLVGRVIWGLASTLFFHLIGSSFSWKLFVTAGFLNAIPGLFLQIILIPMLVLASQKAGLIQS